MEALFLKLVNMSITASWMVLAIIAVRFLFRKTPKWILCLLWGLVAFRLICPFSIESALSLIPNPEPLPQDIIYTAHPQLQSGIVIIDNTVNPMLESSMTPIEPASANPTQIWSFILSQVWILGMVMMLLYTVISYLLLKRKVATAIPLGKGIRQSEFIDSPFVLGLIRPVIYLPFEMEEADMSYVIAHEKSHIRRRDHWWKPFGFLLLSIYWFNPVLWVAYILLCRDIEAACDEKVIKDMKMDDRRAYSTALLNCSIHRRRIAACPLAFGETGVKTRVKGIMNYRKPAFWVILIALIVSIVVAVCFLTNPKSDEEDASGYELIQTVTSQDGYSILSQESATINLVIEKAKLPDACFTLKGHTFEPKEVIPYQTFADNKLYLKHVGIDEERSEYLRFTFAFQTDSLELENLLLPYHVDIAGNGFICNVEVNRGEVWDNQKTYENAAYFEPVMNGEGFFVLVKKSICEAAGHHIAFMLNDMNRLSYEIKEEKSPVTISAENATATGATILFHQDASMIQGELICSHEFFLQQQVNGQWVDMPKIPGAEFPPQTYNIATLHHHGIDWEWMYGKLEAGNYRLGKVIPITTTSGVEPLYTTVYAEFRINNVHPWFDENYNSGLTYPRKTGTITIPGTETKLLYRNQFTDNRNEDELLVETEDGYKPVITGTQIRNVYLTDLTGDGIAEVCATVWAYHPVYNFHIAVYDYSENIVRTLESPGELQYELTCRNDTLIATMQTENLGSILQMGTLALIPDNSTDGYSLQIVPLNDSFRELTETITCIDLYSKKTVCLSSREEIESMTTLLHDLQGMVEPVSDAEMEPVLADDFNWNVLLINYALGARQLRFSADYQYLWEDGMEGGYRIQEPDALRTFLEDVTDGVRNRETSGEPFATMDTPWDWCEGLRADAVSTANMNVKLYTVGNKSSSTGGAISSTTLEELISVLNQIPQSAFQYERTGSQTSYQEFSRAVGQTGVCISLTDTVNQMLVAVRTNGSRLELLTTNDLEKMQDEYRHEYFDSLKMWTIESPELSELLQTYFENPPVITYTVGSEFDWQPSVKFAADDFRLTLRLIEGWEYEEYSDRKSSGIRCRPADVEEGWIYFSYWPNEFKPVEEDRYYSDGYYNDRLHRVSHPSSVSNEMGIDTRNAIWSYQYDDLVDGDYAIINDGADSWFLEYKDQISDIVSISMFSVE